MNIIFEYISKHKRYAISTIILTNIGMSFYKFNTYKKLTDIMSQINNSGFTENIFLTFFIKLMIVHLVLNLTKYLIENIISLGIKDLFRNIVRRIVYNSMDFFKKDNIQTKISQIWLYLSNIELLIEKILIDLPKILTFIVYYIYMIYNLYPPSLLFLLPINLFIMYALHPFSKKQYKLQKQRTVLDIDVKNKLLEVTSNIEHVKLNNKEDTEINRISESFNKYIINKINDKWVNFNLDSMSSIFSDFLTLTIYSIGSIFIIKRNIDPTKLLYLAINTGNFYYQLIQLKDIYNYYKKITPKIEIVNEIMNIEINKLNESNCQKELTYNNDDDIIFENITFSYNGVNNVLNNVNFEFTNNQINLLLGPNGSGKSTLIKLLLKLYNLGDKSNIYFKGVNIKDIDDVELRRKIIFVSQEPYIFNETVLYNLKYGNDDINDDKIIELGEILNSKNWLIKNKNKSAGFRGRNLSGGEKKKIQLMNAISKNAEVIVFDEPTNTLDSKAIQWFNEFVQILKYKYKKTIIIITHDIRLRDVSDHIIDLSI